MKMVIAIAAILLLSSSTALAGWVHGVPIGPHARVVHAYYPVAPAYAYPAPWVVARPSVMVGPHVTYRAPVMVGPHVTYRAPVAVAPYAVYRPSFYRPSVVMAPQVAYPAPVFVRPKVYVWGQPVRNTVRAVLP